MKDYFVCKKCGTSIGDGEGVVIKGNVHIVSAVAKDDLERVIGNDTSRGITFGNLDRHTYCWPCLLEVLHIPFDRVAKALMMER